jgi:NADH:ubiquinone oxidoreductase subunit F (NADH-binding)
VGSHPGRKSQFAQELAAGFNTAANRIARWDGAAWHAMGSNTAATDGYFPTTTTIYGLAGGPPDGREVLFWFPGGSSSPVLTKDDLDLPYDFDSMAKAGSMLGSGAIIVVDDSNSVVDVCLKLASFYRHESCGKCTPCREGTARLRDMLDGHAPADRQAVAELAEVVRVASLCGLGQAAPLSIALFRIPHLSHL